MHVSMDGVQQSTHASMPRVARRTRIRTSPVRRAARRGRKRKSRCNAHTDVSVERRALTRVGFVERCTCASVDIRGDRRILPSADARHEGDVCVHKALWPSITLFGCMRPAGQQTRAVKSRFVRATLCFFWFVPGGALRGVKHAMPFFLVQAKPCSCSVDGARHRICWARVSVKHCERVRGRTTSLNNPAPLLLTLYGVRPPDQWEH